MSKDGLLRQTVLLLFVEADFLMENKANGSYVEFRAQCTARIQRYTTD